MKNLFLKHFSVRGQKTTEQAVKSFSIGERFVFFILVTIMSVSVFSLLINISNHFTVNEPISGGSFREGIVGSPRFINPVLALSDADRDLSSLLFSGLMRAGDNKILEPELASYYEISSDGLTYTFHLKDNIFFHDGEPITADDVLFTIEKAKDPAIKSPKRAEWEGVTPKKIDDKTVAFVLTKPYFPFIENTTLGIIPKHIWAGVSPEEFPFSLQNIKPVGSGPFKINSTATNKADIPISYTLGSFQKYLNNPPYLNQIKILFYKNEAELIKAWQNNEIDSFGGVSPKSLKDISDQDKKSILNFNLPRIFGVFFNQNQNSIFETENIRIALDLAVDKQKILDEILLGYGEILSGPLPNNLLDEKPIIQNVDREKAISLLEKSGWHLKKNQIYRTKTIKQKDGEKTLTLKFSLSAPNVPELKLVAEKLAEDWKKIGVLVDIKLFELSDLNQNVIRPRQYEALLFGEVIGRNPDLTAFWHSSGRNDPGYNIALYTNTKTDTLLEQLRIETNRETRLSLLRKISKKITADTPAIFLYSPNYLYLPPKNIKGLKSGFIASPDERFSEIKNWYVETQNIWPIFKKSQI